MTFQPDTVFHRAPGLLATEIEGELVMMDVKSGNYYNLDRIGAAIWRQLENPIGFEALCQDLHRHYDAPLGSIRQDVAALLSELLTHKLVTTSTP